ncbi:glycosyltransferase family 20 protein [Hypholoma sublateritium FD-334 SS-4]|uniref:Glycosyltransferase family 20 protein n=1 Tax=Hypholoma sublateritium (strain FD-334 SS-4) TaxID=945553 RepID=A0A0D2PBA8_HYPSF|nr:glycosyltransferase family 20 protein [Hypholoma sublateritium FD-334 SS-4]
MDSFAEPYTRQGDDISIEQVRQNIALLEDEHRKAGMTLSGRIIHVCHYLPIAATFEQAQASTDIGVLSPPATPPTKASEVPPADVAEPVEGETERKPGSQWSLSPRHGHAAMISGIRSLSHSHEQLIVGWTGDIFSSPTDKVPVDSITPENRADFEDALNNYLPKESDPDDERDRKTKYVPVWLDDKVAHGHYDGYCKQTLWPLFHYLLWQDVATEYSSADSHYPFYEAANAAFARRISDIYRPGDLIWVHDYHLLLVPKLVRESIPEAVLGLFVHTPFPSSEVFRCLPRECLPLALVYSWAFRTRVLGRKEILDGMLGANLVCFQTYSYSRHFISTCIRVCGYETTTRGIDVEGHVTAVMHCPVGIDAERVARDITRPGIKPKLEALRNLYEGKKIIVGRDKLDVVKGVLQKLRAFEKLLQDYPQWVGNVVMIQVTSPALTDSPKLERMVSELVAHINGEYGSLDFIPVHHYHQQLKKDEFYALLSVSDLAVITPLRDGMNTTSMEFVIAQNDTGKNPSVLSEFMGISKNMEDALLVNPWNLGDVAAAINQGLIMDPKEKAARHAKLYKVVTTHTSHTWAAVLVKMLLGQMGLSGTARQTPYIPQEQLDRCYKRAQKRLFLFDYDGTLAPIVKTPSMATPSDATLEALEKLSQDPKNIVWIISGRDGAFLEQHLGHLTNIGFSAEHGGFVRERGSKEWTNFTKNLDMSWMAEVEEIFKYYTERTTGSHIEMKKSSITWHYRATDPEWGQFQCRQCQDLLENNLAHKRPIEVLVGKKNLEVRPIAVNKGEIVKRILYQNPDADFIFCAGDDKTDEDMFRALLLFPPGVKKVTMPAPVSVTLVDDPGAQPVDLKIEAEAVFTTAVGHSSKRTLAAWHVNTPHEVVEHTLALVKDVPFTLPPVPVPAPAAADGGHEKAGI